jgi:hypothetical protein
VAEEEEGISGGWRAGETLAASRLRQIAPINFGFRVKFLLLIERVENHENSPHFRQFRRTIPEADLRPFFLRFFLPFHSRMRFIAR